MLNKDMDWDKARQSFSEKGWVRINQVFESEFSIEVEQVLKSELKWDLFYTDTSQQPVTVGDEQVASMDMSQRTKLSQDLLELARSKYAFYYYKRDLREENHPVINELRNVIGSEKYFGFVRYVTGELGINSMIASATCYRPSCFLKTHDDYDPDYDRKVAHVFGFSRDWQLPWGGILHLLDDNGQLRDVVPPDFNSLTLFKVPTNHFVSQVASFAPENRYSVTGWFLK